MEKSEIETQVLLKVGSVIDDPSFTEVVSTFRARENLKYTYPHSQRTKGNVALTLRKTGVRRKGEKLLPERL